MQVSLSSTYMAQCVCGLNVVKILGNVTSNTSNLVTYHVYEYRVLGSYRVLFTSYYIVAIDNKYTKNS